jgi:hypothetical protein
MQVLKRTASILVLLLLTSIVANITMLSIPASANASVDVSLVYFKGEQRTDSSKLEKSYTGKGEVKNTSSRDITDLKGTAVAYFRGISIASYSIEFPIKEVKAGETVPFFVWFSKINFAFDVEEVKFTFDDLPSTGPIFVPNISFAESKAWDPGIWSYRVSGRVQNNGPDNLDEVWGVMSFYDSQGRLMDYATERLPGQAIFVGSNIRYPVFNTNFGFNALFYGPGVSGAAASYKVRFVGKKINQQSQPVVVSNVSNKPGTRGIIVSGNLTNPGNQNISTTHLIISAIDASGKVIALERDFFHDVTPRGDYPAVNLGPGETKGFRVEINFNAAESMVRVEVQAMSYDRFDRAAVATGTGSSFIDPAFQSVWQRTDKPITDGVTSRSWLWGPQPFFSAYEEYAQAPGGKRLVQYFDKSRMEINNPNEDKSSPYFVTNGLIASEMMNGFIQVGDAQFKPKPAAEIGVAGDADDNVGPTYATLGKVTKVDPLAVGANISATLTRGGIIGNDPATTSFGVKAAYFVKDTNHTIASPFWDYLNSKGPTYGTDGKAVNNSLFSPTFYATGYPVTEAYWTKVKVAGQVKDVLVQAFERRVLTYTPSNPKGYEVEMGNVGQHYYAWRYGSK